MAQEIQYQANTGAVQISTANPNLDGSGTLGTVLTAGAKGCLIKNIIVKATGNTSLGMVRLFVESAGSTLLMNEVEVDDVAPSGTIVAFTRIIPVNYSLKPGDVLKASTQNSETFNVVAFALDWSYGSTVRHDMANYVASTNGNLINTANSNLDGSGTIVQVFSPNNNGSNITSIYLKAQSKTAQGMVRLFLRDGSGNFFLFWESLIPEVLSSSNVPTFSYPVLSDDSLVVGKDYTIWATTQNSEPFTVMLEAYDWVYPT